MCWYKRRLQIYGGVPGRASFVFTATDELVAPKMTDDSSSLWFVWWTRVCVRNGSPGGLYLHPQCKPGPSICQNFWQYGWYHNNDHDHDDDGDGSGGNNSDNNNNSDYDVDDGVDDHEEENIVDDGDGDPRVNPCYQSVKTWLIW